MNSTTYFNHIEAPFTELFTILKKQNIQSQGEVTLAYHSDELRVMHQHIDNATDILLKGLQDIGNTISLLSVNKIISLNDMESLGFFISAISNLTEALNTLRLDVDHVLKYRGVTHY